jgi:thiamine-phosphate pyrophosphorylase
VKTLPGGPLVCLITTGESSPENFSESRDQILDAIAGAARERVSMVQIREKALTARQLFELSKEAARITASSTTTLFVNGRPDIALEAGADGVHLPSDGLPAAAVKNAFGNRLLIGVSTHSLRDIEEARESGADFVTFGPVFATPGKGEPQGVDMLARVCVAMHGFPVIAVGGVDGSNFRSIFDAGAAGFAAIRFLNDAAARERVILPMTGQNTKK